MNGVCVLQDFVMGLSILLRGTVQEKLIWAFNLYDINKDGYITKEVTYVLITISNGRLYSLIKGRFSPLNFFFVNGSETFELCNFHKTSLQKLWLILMPCFF